MKRKTFAYEVYYGKMWAFRAMLGQSWEIICDLLDRNQITNFSLHACQSLVFGYYECDEGICLSSEDEETLEELIQDFGELGCFIAKPGEGMRLMYHNIGRVRENKELIRLRVFMARLKPGCEEEFKRRHDTLVEKRQGRVDPGPDSNFTIWCAGGYIFGYDEIDTTMESEPDEEQAAASYEWEMSELEIMDWLSNDVDQMTGEHHPAVCMLGWHNR